MNGTVVIKIQGGLGNQLFQYALYRKHLELKHDVYVDVNKYGCSNEPRQFELDHLSLELRNASYKDIEELKYGSTFISRLFHRKIKKKKSYVIEQKEYVYDSRILSDEEMYLEGFWQNKEYFSDIRNILLDEIKFIGINEEPFLMIQDTIRCDNSSVSVHIRRGDFLTVPEKYCGICTNEYYGKAIALVKKSVPDAHFYVFSDDLDVARKMLEGSEYTIVDCNQGENSYLDMYLMSICKHNIIANSSFSWWGAWLNQNNNKIVVCPGKWVNYDNTSTMACKGWLVV